MDGWTLQLGCECAIPAGAGYSHYKGGVSRFCRQDIDTQGTLKARRNGQGYVALSDGSIAVTPLDMIRAVDSGR